MSDWQNRPQDPPPVNQWGPDSVIGNSPLNPHHPSSQAYRGQQPPKKKRHTLRTIGIVIGSLFALLIVAAVLGGGQQPAGTTAPSPVVTSVDNGPTPDPVVTPTNKPTATKAPEKTATQPAPKPTKAAPKLTMAQEQAIGSAEEYLSMQGFSRKGLIKQLSSQYGEGFSKADATFAVDHLNVNWNEQAVRSAKSYLEMQHFSRAGLIKQLESAYGEQFTHSQAVYGVNKAGL